MLTDVIEFRIDRRSGVSTYMQIVQQVKQAMRLGLLTPGDRLPSAREVVEATAVNPNTVLKAYRELEREELVEGRRGLGTFVTKSLSSEATTGDDAPLRQELIPDHQIQRNRLEQTVIDLEVLEVGDVREAVLLGDTLRPRRLSGRVGRVLVERAILVNSHD